MLENAGIDAIELSGGTSYAFRIGQVELSWGPTRKRTVYWREAAEMCKAKVDVPLMLVGGIRSIETAEQLVQDGIVDYVSMCRPFIREPDLVNRWKAGDTRKAECVSDNFCGYESLKSVGLHCVTHSGLLFGVLLTRNLQGIGQRSYRAGIADQWNRGTLSEGFPTQDPGG